MNTFRGWMVVALLFGTMAYAVAEDLTLTTYYPSPRGVYQAMRLGNPVVPPGASANLQITKVAGSANPLLRIDADTSWASPVIVDTSGNLGIGTASPSAPLTVQGAALFVSTITVQGGGPAAGECLMTLSGNGDATWDYPRYAP